MISARHRRRTSNAVALAALLAAAGSRPAFAQSYATHGNWSIVCDNVRRCTAIGYPDENAANAFVEVTRGGAAGAQPAVLLAVNAQGPPRDRKLKVELHRLDGPDIPIGPLDAIGDGVYARAIVPPLISLIMLAALRESQTMTIRLVDRPTSAERGAVVLDGARDALAAMDVRQHRAGTVTALVRRGDAPASSIPPVPPLPVVAAQVMRALPTPASPGPNLVPGADPICGSAGEMWIGLPDGRRVRGVCTMGGAYNIAYRFFFAGTRTAIVFRTPWRRPVAGDADLVNPALAKDGRMLHSFSKGIGLGMCGEAADWVWTGTAFRLLQFREMRECRGLVSDDWPIVYEARMR